MSGTTGIAAVEAAVKETYAKGGIEDLNETASPTLKEVEVGSPDEINSRSLSIVIRPVNSPIQRYGTAEFGDFAPPSSSRVVKVTCPFIGVTKTVGFSHQVLAENNLSSMMIDVVADETDNALDQMMENKNIDLWGDGSGERARVSGVSTLTVTCNNSGNLYGTQLLEEGMEIEYRDASGNLKQGGGINFSTISAAPNNSAQTFTVDQIPSDVANNDRIYFRKSYNAHPRGFLYHVAASGAWQGLSDRTIYRNTFCPLQNAASAALSIGLLDKTTSGIAFRRKARNGGGRKYYVSSQWDAYLQTGYEMKTQETEHYDGGYKTITHAGRTFEWDPHVQRDMLWDLSVKELKEGRMQKVMLVKNAAGGYFHQATAANGQGYASGKYMMWEGWYNYYTKNPVKLGTRIYTLSTTGLELGNS